MVDDDTYYDYIYQVWRMGGNPNLVAPDDVPEDYDWVWDRPLGKHLPKRDEWEECDD